MTERSYEHDAGVPETDATIAAFERQHGIALLPEYKSFLKEFGTLYIGEDPSNIVEEGKLGQSWPFEVYRFPGLGIDFADFFDPKFLRIGYVVGSDGGGNTMLHLTAGRFAGQIGMIDHEVYFGCMDELLKIEKGHYPDEPDNTVAFQSFETATDEQIIEECEANGALAVFEITFGAFMSQLDELYRAAYVARVNSK